MNGDNLNDIDALGRRAATALHRDIDRRIDVDAALRAVLEAEHTAGPAVHLPVTNRTSRRPGRVWLGAAAAVALVAAGAVGYAATRDPGRRVEPAEPVLPTSVDATPTPETVSTVAPPDDSVAPPDASATPPPDTTPATEPTSPPTTAPRAPAAEVDALEELVAPAPLDPVMVPTFLPSSPVGDPTQVRLTQFAMPTDAVTDLVQIWATPTGEQLLAVTTRLGDARSAEPSSTNRLPVEVWPWDEAYVDTTMSVGVEQLHLRDPSGSVTLWGSMWTADDLVAIAREMSLAPNGWQLGPVFDSISSELVSGWNHVAFGTRTMRWDTGTEQGELIVSIGMPDTVRSGFFPGTAAALEKVGDAPALVTTLPTGTAVSWSPAPDVVLLLGYTGSIEETLALARSVVSVDEATWLAAGVDVTSSADGCDSSFFC